MKRTAFLIILILTSFRCFGQGDTNRVLSQVIVSGIADTKARNTSLHIVSYKLGKLEAEGPHNLSDAMSEIPGVSQMNTGNAISKPVVRGLYGNRLLVLLSGLRFDNQQWQDEHGLGLSQIGIDRVELIKGPASLLYGTDAIGGVINVVEALPLTQGLFTDFNTRLYSNTLGTLTDIGLSSLHGHTWWRLRAGLESHADYQDGDNHRILNSRNQGYYLKAGFGFQRKAWIQSNAYNFSYNQFGFIMDSLRYFEEDGRWARRMAGPHHNVMFNTLSSQNTFLLHSSVLKLNVGLQSNKRAEDEGGGEISLDMHLLSVLENVRWEKPVSGHTTLVANQQFTFENNTNYGKRVLIPDADMMESNLSLFIRHEKELLALEAGVGYSFKQINTFKTHELENDAFSVFRPSFNAMAGATYNPGAWLNIKANIATGYRAPNLAELSSNGIHEGTYRFEIGDKNLKAEQNINGDITTAIVLPSFELSASAFYNHFNNYIYQAPSGDSFLFLYPIYNFVQQDAHLYGGEISASVKPSFIKNLRLQEVFSITNGVLDHGGYLPFIPPYKSVTSLRLERQKTDRRIHSVYIEPSFVYVWKQDRPALFETETPGYALVNLSAGLTMPSGKSEFRINASVRNIGNVNYYDHLSRLKDYGFHNEGRDFVLTLSYCPGSFSSRSFEDE